MADHDKDELADALARLAAGEHHDEADPDASQHGHDSIEAPPPPAKAPVAPAAARVASKPATPPVRVPSARPTAIPGNVAPTIPAPPTAPVVKRSASPGPAVTRPTAPVAPSSAPARTAQPVPASARPAAPLASQSGDPATSTRPATPSRPTGPPAAAAPVSVEPVRQRPATPTAPSIESTFVQPPSIDSIPPESQATPTGENDSPDVAAQALEMEEIYEGDDMDAPAPDASVFAPKARASAKARKPRQPYFQTLFFRQTAIPIMLTCGFIMLLTAGLALLSPADSMFAGFPGWFSIVLIAFGLILLGLAGLNMVQVKNELEQSAAAQATN